MNDPRAAKVRTAHLSVVITLITAAAVAHLSVVLLTVGDLPARLATHFSFDGIPDDTTATSAALILFGVVSVGVPGLLLVVFGAGQWWRGSSSRFLTAFVAGITAGLSMLSIQLIWAHRGVNDEFDVRLTGSVVLATLAVGVGIGLLVAVVLPRPLAQPPPVAAVPMAVASSDRVTWFGQARTSQDVLWVLVFSVITLVVATVVSGIWWLWFAVLLMCVLLLSISTFRVRIDSRGLAWRSAIGLPRGSVHLDDVTAATVQDVRPGDFGGYGVRLVRGKTGLITRAGEALSVTDKGRELVITVDDATTAASVLEGLRIAAACGP